MIDMKDIRLTELINIKILQRLQDAFSEYAGMAALITDENGAPVTKGSGFTELCMNHVRQCEKGAHNCEECDRMGAVKTYESGKPVVYTCHIGLIDYAAPIMVEDDMIGCIIGGQVRKEPQNEEHDRAVARSLGIDEASFLEAARKINIVDEDQVLKAAKFLTELAALLSDMAFENYMTLKNSQKLEKMSRSQMRYMIDMYSNMENTFNLWLESVKLSAEKNDYEAMVTSLEVLVKNGKEIFAAFGNTVEYAKMTDGDLALSETTYNFRSIVNDAIMSQRSLIKKNGNKIVINTSDSVSLRFFGDTGRLKQLTSILIKLGNNFTTNGTVQIDMRSEKIDYADMLVIEVRDNGVGIPEDNRIRLNKYMQHASMSLQGCTEDEEKELFILRMLVGQLSGNITFESTQNEGTVVRVAIPQLEMK